MSHEDVQLVPLEVPQAGGPVEGGGQNAAPVGREGDGRDRKGVTGEDGLFATVEIPQAGAPVLFGNRYIVEERALSQYEVSRGGEGHVRDLILVAAKDRELLSLAVEDAGRVVVVGRHDDPVARR